jgi:hypothetical protein
MKHSFLDGKYEVLFDEKTGRLRALRYGETWRDLDGDGLVLAMLQEVNQLREQLRTWQAARAALLGGTSPEAAPAVAAGSSAAKGTPGRDIDLNQLGSSVSDLLLQRTRQAWNLAMEDFRRGQAQLSLTGQDSARDSGSDLPEQRPRDRSRSV